MTINFQPDDAALAKALVESTTRANGKWVGPFDATIDGKPVMDIKYPIGALRAVVRSRENLLHTLVFGLHFIAQNADAAQNLFAKCFIDMNGKNGTLILAGETYTGASISGANLINKGAYLRANLSITF